MTRGEIVVRRNFVEKQPSGKFVLMVDLKLSCMPGERVKVSQSELSLAHAKDGNFRLASTQTMD